MYQDQASALRKEVACKEQTIRALVHDVIIEDTLLGSIALIGKKTGTHSNRVLEVLKDEVDKL